MKTVVERWEGNQYFMPWNRTQPGKTIAVKATDSDPARGTMHFDVRKAAGSGKIAELTGGHDLQPSCHFATLRRCLSVSGLPSSCCERFPGYLLSSRVRGRDGWSLSQVFCARFHQQLTPSEDVFSGELLTTEQVRRTANVFSGSMSLPSRVRRRH